MDVCAKLRGILKTKKVGHGGTLDPAVTGVLPVAVGKATRLLEYMDTGGKIYEGEITLGFSTETEDAQGAVIDVTPVFGISEEKIDAALAQFLGVISQIPPMYSAVKVNGRRLYEYARQGLTIERAARSVEITDFARTSDLIFVENCAKFSFRVACSKGTYVRTLAVDVAKNLGFAGHMSQLTRTMANGLFLEDAHTLDEIADGKFTLQPLITAVSGLVKRELSADEARDVCQGKFIAADGSEHEGAIIAGVCAGELIAILEKRDSFYKPKKVVK